MKNAAAVAPRVIVIPHVAPYGGAGIYIKSLVKELSNYADISLLGNMSSEYGTDYTTTLPISFSRRPILPTYFGSSIWAFLFYISILPLAITQSLIIIYSNRHKLSQYNILIMTSSIDLITSVLFKILVPDITTVCIIQENAILVGLRGFYNKLFMRRIDILVSITNSWSAQAKKFDIDSQLIINPFLLDAELYETSDGCVQQDIVYVGGGEKNKGFMFFVNLCELLSQHRQIRAMILGRLSKDQEFTAEACAKYLRANGSNLDIIGFVVDSAYYIRRAKILLLPITAPHFCRPAVEAGFLRRTFVVSDFADLEEFAIRGHNCMTAASGDLSAWASACHMLLDNDELRHTLAVNNEQRSIKLFSFKAYQLQVSELVRQCS